MTDQLLSSIERMVEDAVKAGRDVHQIKADYGKWFSEELLDTAISNFRSRTDAIYDLIDPYVIAHQKLLSQKFRWYPGPNELSVRWEFARQKLLSEGRSAAEIAEVLHSSSQVLGLLNMPGADKFASRGLVLGYVQSGKTTNFIATIAQAADVGYRLIIVLSGVTNNLRKQTQERLEMSLTGTNSQNWHWLTSLDSDFNETKNAGVLLNKPGDRVIAVIKKNNTRLKKLQKWLESAPQSVRQGLPVLIIDDEADQATVNSHKQIDRQTAINKTLTSMLKMDFLPKNAYLGYTATPFANILSDAKDQTQLFPRDFIYPLKRSEKYFGAEQLFGREPIDEDDQEVAPGRNIIIPISAEDRTALGSLINPEDEHRPTDLPQSLKDAVLWFVVATAARRIRSGKKRFSTMLVHTSGRIPCHKDMKQLLSDYLNELINITDVTGCTLLESCWSSNCRRGWIPGDSEILAWEEIAEESSSVLNELKIIVDNSQSDDRLVYDFANEEMSVPVIVVGGNTLARGLTLEGLICSFFMRTSSSYDSLLQMGRWFGYRVGYEDLQRIWMQEDLILNFRDMALVEEEIRIQIAELAEEGLDPSQVPIKIRDHKLLTITALNKMKHAVRLQVGYSDTRVETVALQTSESEILANQDATRRFISSIGALGIDISRTNAEGWPIFKGVPWALVKKYFNEYSWASSAHRANRELIKSYVDFHQVHRDMELWNVFVYQIFKKGYEPLELGNGISATQINRSALEVREESGIINIHHLVSSIDGGADVGLTKREIATAIAPKLVSDATLRKLREESEESRKKGLLGIYVINPESKAASTKDNRTDLHLKAAPIGLGIFFGTSHVMGADLDYFGPDLPDAFENVDEDDYLVDADATDDEFAS